MECSGSTGRQGVVLKHIGAARRMAKVVQGGKV